MNALMAHDTLKSQAYFFKMIIDGQQLTLKPEPKVRCDRKRLATRGGETMKVAILSSN